ncbi:hypothetical protein QJU23_01155 [Pasteurella atlantica]|uniref:Uncharacterized protein n=2 Tax=Pasteurellaceae TaxID=712 RepID=A0ACC6HJH7_9PAST|nr:hypothetical protein [Pasteurella atlantica]MDP8051029.1 hypothetical protein [Pasteurella atlantica]MDP8104325.1 hypothetical protein [Pasteurella atlantica]MDP8147685.1 hypothetical protein [Pasteurella atlantica]
MSLEQALQENTAAVNKLSEILQGLFEKGIEIPKKVKKEAKAQVKAQATAQVKAQAKEEAKAQDTDKVDLVSLRQKAAELTVSVAKINRESVVSLLAEFNVKKLTDVSDSDIEQYFNKLLKLKEGVTNAD